MVLYKSHCRDVKTFYGVTFRYGETKAVSGYIHDPRFVCLGTVSSSSVSTVVSKPAVVGSNPAKIATAKEAAKKLESKVVEPKKSEAKRTETLQSTTKASIAKSESKDTKKDEVLKSDTKKEKAQKSGMKKEDIPVEVTPDDKKD